MRILLLSPSPSPFNSELARHTTQSGGFECFHVWFASALPVSRGPHWLTELDPDLTFSRVPLQAPQIKVLELSELLAQCQYDVIVSQIPLVKRDSWRPLAEAKRSDAAMVFWGEQLCPGSHVRTVAKSAFYRWAFHCIGFDAVFAIGDRAVQQYRAFAGVPVFLVPYFQDLRPAMRLARRASGHQPFTFLFSGQLIERNNICGMIEACRILSQQHGNLNFRLLLYGGGPLVAFIETARKALPFIELRECCPATWTARLDVLAEADVLLTPAAHSGWGLTIPEALASGMPVISTSGVEAARYYIRDGCNGFIATAAPGDIARRMLIFLEEPELASKMSDRCKLSAAPGDVEQAARVLPTLFRQLKNGS